MIKSGSFLRRASGLVAFLPFALLAALRQRLHDGPDGQPQLLVIDDLSTQGAVFTDGIAVRGWHASRVHTLVWRRDELYALVPIESARCKAFR